MGFFDEKDNKAFEPFMDTKIVVNEKGGLSQTLSVSIFDDVEGEPINSDLSIDTEKRQVSLIANKDAWAYCKNLKRGDTILIQPQNEKYSIMEVKNDRYMGIVIKAREA